MWTRTIHFKGGATMISEKIRELRKKANLSQESLAEKLGVSRQAVTKWETGAGDPDISNIIAIAELFQVSIDQLVGNKTITKFKEKQYAYESVTEYDIDCQKNFDITFMGAKSVIINSYESEKVKIILSSNTIENLQKVIKTKIDDVKKKIDIDIKRTDELSETRAKNEVFIEIMLPLNYMGKIELEGNTKSLGIHNIENENIEYSGKVKEVFVENSKSHIEIDSNEDMKIKLENVEGRLDVNQISSTSKIFISKDSEFGAVAKGVLTKLLYEDEMPNLKELSEEPKLVIELNGIKSELEIVVA